MKRLLFFLLAFFSLSAIGQEQIALSATQHFRPRWVFTQNNPSFVDTLQTSLVPDFALGSGTPPIDGQPAGPTGFAQTSNFSVGLQETFELGKRGPRREAADLRTREAIESAVGSLGGRINDAATTLGKLEPAPELWAGFEGVRPLTTGVVEDA